jgi:hypothetical protein
MKVVQAKAPCLRGETASRKPCVCTMYIKMSAKYGTIIYSPEGGYILALEGIELCNLFDSNCVRYAAIRGLKLVNGSAHELYTWPEWDDKTKTCLEAWLENMPSPYMQNAGEISEYMWTVCVGVTRSCNSK